MMDTPELIRNIALCGHLHHGKVLSTLLLLPHCPPPFLSSSNPAPCRPPVNPSPRRPAPLRACTCACVWLSGVWLAVVSATSLSPRPPPVIAARFCPFHPPPFFSSLQPSLRLGSWRCNIFILVSSYLPCHLCRLVKRVMQDIDHPMRYSSFAACRLHS